MLQYPYFYPQNKPLKSMDETGFPWLIKIKKRGIDRTELKATERSKVMRVQSGSSMTVRYEGR